MHTYDAFRLRTRDAAYDIEKITSQNIYASHDALQSIECGTDDARKVDRGRWELAYVAAMKLREHPSQTAVFPMSFGGKTFMYEAGTDETGAIVIWIRQ